MSELPLSLSSSIQLQHGHKLPMLGLGTYTCTHDDAKSAVSIALSLGYRHIDTAEFYNNHEGIAQGIEHSGIPRSDIFITDKVSPGGNHSTNEKSFDEIIETCKTHLKRLNTDYVDLYLLHHAYAKRERINQYKALLELQRQGLVREVGVSNWNISHIEEIKAAGLPLPAANQIEIHPLCTQEPLIAYLKQHHIVPIAYSSLAPSSNWRVLPGQRSAKPVTQSIDHTTPTDTTNSNTTASSEHSASEALTACGQLISELSAKYGVSDAQILLRWAIQLGYPIIPKSSKIERIRENASIFHFSISSDDMPRMSALNIDSPFAWPTGNPLHCL